jgi:uncharacterized membrane protein YccC
VVATGALNVSYSDGTDPYFRRGGRMLMASLIASIAVVIGGLVGSHHTLAIALATAWAFAAGMLVALDNAAADIGLISLVTLIIFGAQPLTPEQAVYSGLLAFGGGLLQIVLSLAVWPLRRHEPEQRVCGNLYVALSRLAAEPVNASASPPVTDEISTARRLLSVVVGARSSQAERYWSLVSQAERIRLSLLMISRLHARLGREPDTAADISTLEQARDLASRILRQVGDELLAGGSSAVDPGAMKQFTGLADAYREAEVGSESPAARALVSQARFQLDALAGQLRASMDLAAFSTRVGREVFERRQAQNPWRFRVAGGLAILRANLSFESAAFRHAVRMGLCVGAGDLIGRSLGWERSYWLPMTVAIILKPDFSATLTRGVLRLVGTAFGLLLATGLFHALPLTAAAEVALLAAVAFVMRCYGPANYGIFVAAVSALVVLLFALSGVAPADVVASRAASTIVGGVLAVGVYAVWPTWERKRVPEMMAILLDKYREYFRAVRQAYVYPEQTMPHDEDARRMEARVARTNLEASVERLRSEPGVDAETIELLGAMLASSHRFAHAAMALEAGLTRSHPVPARPEFVTFANQVELTLYLLASALRGSRLDATQLPDLRAAHHALTQAGDPLMERYALVNVEADRMTNSLNTLAGQLAQWPGAVAFSSGATSSQ